MSDTITRAEAAKLLRVSVFKIRSLQKAGLLTPIERPDGTVEYARAELDRVKAAVLLRSHDPGDPGALAAKAFRLFDQGKDLREVVRRTKQTPEKVRALYAEWSHPDLSEGETRRRERETIEDYSARIEAQAKRWERLLRQIRG